MNGSLGVVTSLRVSLARLLAPALERATIVVNRAADTGTSPFVYPIIQGTLPHWSELTPLEQFVYMASRRAVQRRCIGCGIKPIPEGEKAGWYCRDCPDVWEAPAKYVVDERRSDLAAYAARRLTQKTIAPGSDRPTFNPSGCLAVFAGCDYSPAMFTDSKGNVLYDPDSEMPSFDRNEVVTVVFNLGYVENPHIFLPKKRVRPTDRQRSSNR